MAPVDVATVAEARRWTATWYWDTEAFAEAVAVKTELSDELATRLAPALETVKP